jgi:hypothetical protein
MTTTSATSAGSATSTTLALKEWGAVAHALLQGRQTLLLRKGGIHEKAFRVEGGGFFLLFPTVAHSHRERVRPEHADLLPLGEGDVAPDALVVRCGVRLVEAVEVRRPEHLGRVADLHIWTEGSIREDRLEFRPRHPLHALVVEAVELPTAVRLAREVAFGGCRSWLDLPLGWDGRSGRPALPPERLAEDAERVRATLG